MFSGTDLHGGRPGNVGSPQDSQLYLLGLLVAKFVNMLCGENVSQGILRLGILVRVSNRAGPMKAGDNAEAMEVLLTGLLLVAC